MGWADFCQANQIPYVKGAKARGGNIEIRCPMCDQNDQSHKMGLHLQSGRWGCWRNKRQHSGRHPKRLIAKLLSVSDDTAEEIAKRYFSANDLYNNSPDALNFDISLSQTGSVSPRGIEPPPEFFAFGQYAEDLMNRLQQPFLAYIKDRGYDPNWVCRRYDLRWCVTGAFAHRIIIPIKKNLVWHTYTGRSINPNNKLRYMTAEETVASPSDFLFDEDNLGYKANRILMVLEGPFDAMKAAQAHIPGLSTTAIFTKTVSDTQLATLMKYHRNFDSTVIAFDRDALPDALQLVSQLRWYIPNVMHFIPDEKDVGAMTTAQIKKQVNDIQQVLQVEQDFKRGDYGN